MSDGISPNPLNDLSKIYLDQVAAIREVRKQETEKDIERWSQSAKEALQHNESVDATASGLRFLVCFPNGSRPLAPLSFP